MSQKRREALAYIIFGILTTIINTLVYGIAVSWIGNVPANILAWVLAVSFAFVTNKLWVFQSRQISGKILLREGASFLSCRLATGILDLMIMYWSVSVFNLPGLIMKCVSNVIVILLNFAASKWIIFKKS